MLQLDLQIEHAPLVAPCLNFLHPEPVSFCHAQLDEPEHVFRKTAIAYRTFFAKNGVTTPDDYSVDHTGFIYLLGKDGRYLGFLPPGLAPDAIADAIRARLGAE